ncbi:MAG: hypothetical protein ABGY96_25765 [bacterium]
MRAIFVTLIMLNIAYFVYQQYIYQAPVKATVTSVKEDGVERIALVSEKPRQSLREKEMDLVVSNPVTVDSRTNTGCMAIGPFADLFQGQNVVEQLAFFDLAVELKAIDSETLDSDFRVMIPPMSSLQEVFRKLRELQSQLIDSHVISQGKDTLGISLGVFSTKEAAEVLFRKMQGAGYNVQIVGIPTVDREFWIFSTSEKDLKLDSLVLADLVASYPSLVLQEKPCPEKQIQR